MVPKGWIDGRVGDLLEGLESGVSVNGEDRDFVGDENAVLKISAVTYGTFDSTAAKVIDGLELDRAKTNPKRGQIIISRSNTEELVGASAYIDRDYPHLFLPDKLWQTIPKQDSDMKWLSYILASSPVRYALSNLATGTSGSMKNITKGELLSLKVLIPPPLEQKQIAQILSIWDKAITTTEQLLANSQQQKKALMQQLLTGKKRLLDNNGVRYSGEWKRSTLTDIIRSLDSGVSVNSVDDALNSEHFVLKTSCVADGIFNPIEKKNVIDVNEIGRLKEPLLNNSILISRMNTPQLVGANAYVELAPVNTYLPDRLWQVKVKQDQVSMQWLGFWFSSPKTRTTLCDLASGTSGSMKNISKQSVLGMHIRLPPIKEQQKIATVLSTAAQEISVLQQKLDALKQEKKALMQQLLTGKRRVKVEVAA